MRYLLMGLMMSLLACGLAFAQGEPATDDEGANETSKYEVTGLPLYQGPGYKSLDSQNVDISNDPQFHAFQHLPVDEIGYSPLTLEDFRFPVVQRVKGEFRFERLELPKHAKQVWHTNCPGYTVTAFFFTRDMIRDHIQRLIDEYYICEPDVVQQVIDYYAEVTPQCGEMITWVWFAVDKKGNHYADRQENRYFSKYLDNFKDKFYLEFGLPRAQKKVDKEVAKFLYQYRERGRFNCGPEFVERSCGCDPCQEKADGCKECKVKDCGDKGCKMGDCKDCPDMRNEPHDKALYCEDFKFSGWELDANEHYVYYPRKVVIEDMTYDPVAQAYRWKFAWRFNDCEVDWLKGMCQYGQWFEFALVLSDPHWFARTTLGDQLKRDLLATMDPNTWGNVWGAGNLPFVNDCCDCPLPSCDGNCMEVPSVGWGYEEPAMVAEVPEFIPMPTPVPEDNDFSYFPPEEEKEDEVIKVKGNG